jgi:hypothetical protein
MLSYEKRSWKDYTPVEKIHNLHYTVTPGSGIHTNAVRLLPGG